MIHLFERHLFHRLYERRRVALGETASSLAAHGSVHGLDTLWRVATFVETAIDHEEPGSLWDIPRPAGWTLEARRATPSDAALLAQAVLAVNGREGLLFTVYDRARRAKQVVCAVQESGMWHHISSQGLFGIYGELREIAEDLCGEWSLYVARDPKMRIVAWQSS